MAFGLMTLVVAVFAPCVGFEFVSWDDYTFIVHNAHLRPPWGANIAFLWRHSDQHLYIPMTYTLLAAERWIAQSPGFPLSESAVVHLGTVLVHTGTVLLLFRLLSRWSGQIGSGAGAALFAVHPLQVESVAWATETKTVLCGFFSVASLLLLMQAGEQWDRNPRSQLAAAGRYVVATVLFAAALLSKPSAVIVPAIALVLLWGMARRSIFGSIASVLPWLILAGVASVWAREEQPAANVALVPSMAERGIVAGDAITFYLQKLVWPVSLGPDEGRPPWKVLASKTRWIGATIPWLLAAVIAIGRWRVLACGYAIFVVGALPTLGLVPFLHQNVSTVADRYVYLAMIGPALVMGMVVHRGNRWTWLAAAAIIGMLAVLAARQVQVWRNDESLFAHAVSVNPQSLPFETHRMRRAILLGRPQEAAAIGERILAWNHPNSEQLLLTHTNQASALLLLGRAKESAIQYRKALAIDPDSLPVELGLANALLLEGNAAEAEHSLQKIVARRPDLPEAHALLGSALAARGQREESIAEFERAIKLRDDPNFHDTLAMLALGWKDDRLAANCLEQEVRLRPDAIEPRMRLAQTLARLGRTREAIVHYREALARAPQRADIRLQLESLTSSTPQ